jgi:hypothetical protein
MSRRKRPDRKKLTRRRRPRPEANSPEAALPLLPAVFGLVDADPDDQLGDELPMWMDEQGLHAMVPGSPAPDTFERLTELYQQKIRNSPLWDEMVSEFGLAKAEQLLKEFRAQPG